MSKPGFRLTGLPTKHELTICAAVQASSQFSVSTDLGRYIYVYIIIIIIIDLI